MLSSRPGRFAFYFVVGISLLAISLIWAVAHTQSSHKRLSGGMVYATAYPEK